MTDFRKKIFAYVKKFASMLRSAECQLKPKTKVAARSAATFILGFDLSYVPRNAKNGGAIHELPLHFFGHTQTKDLYYSSNCQRS